MSARRPEATSSTPAIAVLRRAGVTFRTHEFEHDPRAPSFGLEAAAALDVAAARICKTLVAQTDRHTGKGLVVAVVSVHTHVDLKALAREIGCKRAALADPALASRTTGYLVGAISPLGQKHSLTTVVDAAAAAQETLLVSGGRRGLDIELATDDLIRLTGARVASIAR